MSLWQGRSKRKPSGGRLTANRKKRKYEMGRDPPRATVGDEERFQTIRTRGGSTRTRVLETDTANVQVPSDGETVQAEILTVAENEANPHYVRRNIITKGAVLETSEGPARVTSRPGQDGVVNAVLLEDE